VTVVQQALTGVELRDFMRSWTTGVAIVTSMAGPLPTGCTLDPPLVLISLSERSRTLAAITEHGSYGINVLGARQQHLAARFASELSTDRFAGLDHRLVCGVPLLTDALATAVCTVETTTAAADHVLLVGRPIWSTTTDGVDPAIFFGGRYRALAE
jgi:3-hydroxy-9,10-secoandrosta-1,3,5(10)-triene-9,17-dione monooxygenase reductase component